MPVYITTPQTKTYYVDESNQGWVLSDTGSITVANGHGIVNNDAFHDSFITVAGSILANGMYKDGILSNGPSAALQVEAGGSIHAYSGIAVYGDKTTVQNFGHITAERLGIYVGADDTQVLNTGAITANVGVYFENANGYSAFSNAGTITADRGFVAQNGSAYIKLGATSVIDAKSIGIELSANPVTNMITNDGLIKSGDIAIQGNSTSDRIENTGTIKGKIVLGDGNDEFDNRGGSIDHAVDGGAGDDYYIFGATKFAIIDSSGNDMIGSGFSYALAADNMIENLCLVGTANINGTGNAFVNTISGNSGNNVLYGGNDSVVDTLIGYEGNDTYVLGSGHDLVKEGLSVDLPGTTKSGVDTITSTISRSLADYAFVENLKLLGSSDINGTGGKYANVIVGNSGNNILNGGVEDTQAIDTLNGGAGNDTYVLGSGSDKVIDASGIDTITSAITRSLSAYATIENLKLLGVSNINATGNTLSNTLTGNSGANTLSGGAGNDVLIGSAGADKLDGGTNADTASYKGASAGVVANLANASANTGDAKGDIYVSIENLVGSSHNDTLTGNSGANVMFGTTGADKLTGGAGADIFLFKAAGDSTLAAAGQDTVFDFSHAQGDRIGLSGIDANTALSGDQAFVFKGTAAFSGGKGELHFDKQASDTYVYGDINGDKVADFVLHFDDAIAFQASDFIL
ncbi:beta strand repeat-containing protein [Shinella sp. M31]|uniref:beta strand repeat-containing protein n=1 Tax=Shinella sp. M31 TaxID=3368615 RepID=UPI003B9E2B79